MINRYSCMVKVVSYDSSKIQNAVNLVKSIAKNRDLIATSIPLPTKRKVYTVLRSPHIDKKSREQFESRRRSNLIKIISSDRTIFEAIIAQLKDEIHSGVSLKIKFYNHETM